MEQSAGTKKGNVQAGIPLPPCKVIKKVVILVIWSVKFKQDLLPICVAHTVKM